MNEYLRIDAALDEATRRLGGVSESPRLDAELLLARALDVPRSYLFAHPEDTMDPAAVDRFGASMERRLDGVPLAYITGEKEFWSMRLIVSPDTLVPRPETEVLVEQALMRISHAAELQILELGTGCGAIALAIAKERPACQVVATDLSERAIAVAKENARQLAIPNVEFLAGSWFEPVADRSFDLIVSNPPYVASGDPHLEELRHEPRAALAAGEDGLDAVRHIASAAARALRPGGSLLIEHGDSQADAVAAILDEADWSECVLVRDLALLPRVTVAGRND